MKSLRDPFLLTLNALGEMADKRAKLENEPRRLDLTRPGEYDLFSVLREFSSSKDEAYLSDCARQLVGHLTENVLQARGWSSSNLGRQRVGCSLLAEILVNEERYGALRTHLAVETPSFMEPAIAKLAKVDAP